MKTLQINQTRQEYIETQIVRSDLKFQFCKVSIYDVVNYKSIILKDINCQQRRPNLIGPILCLGTRNGREVDLFRAEFFGSILSRYGLKMLGRKNPDFFSTLQQFIGSFNRSDVKNICGESVVGVELNPRAARSDIWNGSFDEMPLSWKHKFGVVFSNSFDHAQDIHKTAMEWKRIIRPGGYLIFCFDDKVDSPLASDLVCDISLQDVLDLFDGHLVYFQKRGSYAGYNEIIIRLDNDDRS